MKLAYLSTELHCCAPRFQASGLGGEGGGSNKQLENIEHVFPERGHTSQTAMKAMIFCSTYTSAAAMACATASPVLLKAVLVKLVFQPALSVVVALLGQFAYRSRPAPCSVL